MKVLFSIPIHEKFEVVLDQLANVLTLNDDCGIILHISPVFDYETSEMSYESFLNAIGKLGYSERVTINPNKVRTGWFDIIQAHISNYRYASNLLDFEYFSLLSSNELFVRGGLYELMKKTDCGVQRQEFSDNSLKTDIIKAANDKDFNAIRKSLSFEPIIRSQIEGTWYRKDVFREMCDVIERYYDYRLMEFPYSREEIYFPTVFYGLNRSRGWTVSEKLFTYVPWGRNTLTVYFKEVVRLVRGEEDGIFSIKRVAREINDYVRSYIRQYYHLDVILRDFIPCLRHYDIRTIPFRAGLNEAGKHIKRNWKIIKAFLLSKDPWMVLYEKAGKFVKK